MKLYHTSNIELKNPDAFADTDVIIGPIANDTLYDTYGIITSGLVSSEDSLKLAIPENDVPEFKKLLVAYYEDRDNGEIVEFLKTKCWKTF